MILRNKISDAAQILGITIHIDPSVSEEENNVLLQEQLKEGILDLLNEESDEEQFPIELEDKNVRDQAIKEAKSALASLNWMTREMKLRTAKKLNIKLKPEGIN